MNLKIARAIFGVTQMELCNHSGIHQSKLSHIERGYLRAREDEKDKIAAALGVDSQDIDWDANGKREGS